jgi:DNA polymerase-2
MRAEDARALGAGRQAAIDSVTLTGQPVVAIEVPTPSDTPPLRDRLVAAGITTYEADVRFAMRFLIDRGIRGSLEIRGEGWPEDGLGLVFENPEVAPADWTPRLRVLSFDIETDPSARRLLAIGLHGCGASEVLLLTPDGWTCPEEARPFRSERELLTGFARRVRELDPDVLTGWNVVDFDLSVLARIAERLHVSLELGRGTGGLRVRPAGSSRGAAQASVPGRVVLDGIHLMRGAFIRMDDYGVDAVGRSVLGEGKTLAGEDKAGEILRLLKEDRAARRIQPHRRPPAQILEALAVALSVERSKLTGLP